MSCTRILTRERVLIESYCLEKKLLSFIAAQLKEARAPSTTI